MSTKNPRQGRPVARYHADPFTRYKPRLLPVALASCFALGLPQAAYGQSAVTVQSGSWINNSATGLEIIRAGAINGTTKGLNNTITTEYVENRGLVQSSANDDNDNSYALHNTGTIKRLGNTGTFLSVGDAVHNAAGGHIGSVINDGMMNGGAGNGFFNAGSITSLTNADNGRISSTNHNALYNGAKIETLTNSGAILAGKANDGIYVDLIGAINVLDNSGNILASDEGAGVFNSGAIGTIINSGTISGKYAIDNATTGTVQAIVNSGTLRGAVRHMIDRTLNIYGGSGDTIGTITGLSDRTGTIAAGGNINFAGGNLFLNADVLTPGHLIINGGATLMVSNPITFRGNFAQYAGAMGFVVGTEPVTYGNRRDRGYGYILVKGDTMLGSGTGIAMMAPDRYRFAQGQRYVVMVTTGRAVYNEDTLKYTATGYDGTLSGAVVKDEGNSHLVVTVGPLRAKEDAIAEESTPSLASDISDVSDASDISDTGDSSDIRESSDTRDTSTSRRPSAPVNRASTGNANSVLSGLFNYQGVNTRLLDVHNAAAAAGSENEANRLGAQLSPTAVNVGAMQASGAASTAVHNIVSSRLATLRGGGGRSGVSSGERRGAPALWGQLFAGRANQAMRGNVSGYHANYKGMLIGGDVPTAEGWRSGALVSHARTSVGNEGNNSGSSASVDSYGVTGYTSFSGRPGFVNLMAGVTLQRTSTTRAINAGGLSDAAHGNFNGRTYTAALQGGRAIPLGARTTFTPLAGLVYTKQRQNGYSETGGGGAALNVAGAGNSSLKSDIGVKVERALLTSYGRLTPAAQLRWRYEFRDSRLSTTSSFAADTSGATSFTTVGSAAPRNSGALVLSATLARKKNLTLSANYTLEAASGYKAQSGDVRVRWQF